MKFVNFPRTMHPKDVRHNGAIILTALALQTWCFCNSSANYKRRDLLTYLLLNVSVKRWRQNK